jgi:hypothetical protein
MLKEVTSECHAQGLPLLIASPNADVETALSSSGVVASLGGAKFVFRRVHEAVRAVLMQEVTLVPSLPPHLTHSPIRGARSPGHSSMLERLRGTASSLLGQLGRRLRGAPLLPLTAESHFDLHLHQAATFPVAPGAETLDPRRELSQAEKPVFAVARGHDVAASAELSTTPLKLTS